MTKRPLTVSEFFNVVNNSYPTLRLHADQWGECGYFYDPANRLFGYYSIDRKDQCDEVETVATAEELLQRHCSADLLPTVQAWLDSFRIGLFMDQTFLWYPQRQRLERFPLVASPIVVTGEKEALAALDNAYAVKWLQQQIESKI